MEVQTIQRSDNRRREEWRVDFIVNGKIYKTWKHCDVYDLMRALGWINGFIHATEKTEKVKVLPPPEKPPNMCSYCHGISGCNCEW